PEGVADGAVCVEGDGRAAGEGGFAIDDGQDTARVAAGAGGERRRSWDGRALLREVTGVSVGQVPGRGSCAGAGDAVDGRGDGRRDDVWRGVCEGADRGRSVSADGRHGVLQRERS